MRALRRSRAIKRAPDGRAMLYLCREGELFEKQKGSAFHEEWTTVQFSPLPVVHPPGMLVHDIRRGLPFSDASFHAAYSFHVLEHLTPSEADEHIEDVKRLLKPGGHLRISVPDLEKHCLAYLRSLEECLDDPSPRNLARYEFDVLHLFDQMVRDTSGGLLLQRLKARAYEADFLRERTGDVFEEFFAPALREPTLMEKIRARTVRELATEALRRAKLVVWRGDLRKTREAVKWMYDRISLPLLLDRHGFVDVAVKTFRESDIPGWERYDFDRSSHGDYPLEPSLYVDGRKPAVT